MFFSLTDMVLNFAMSQIFTTDDIKKWHAAAMNKTDNDDYCLIWAREGACESSVEFMLKTCARSCAVLEAGVDVHKGMIFSEDKEPMCMTWAKAGECTANEIYMTKSCPQSCVRHQYTEAHSKLLIENYVWNAIETSSIFEGNVVQTLIPGLGALANSHLGLVNVRAEEHFVDSAGYHRATDVGTGAFVDRRVGFKAEADIPAGMEIFLDYGDSYFVSRQDKIGPVPLAHHYPAADKKLKRFWRRVDLDKMNDDTARELYKSTIDSMTDLKVKMLMPETFERAKEVRGISSARLSLPDAVRSPEWLEKNGVCIDNIRPGLSSIQQAGRGAFSSRSIKKGQVIAPMPLIHMDKAILRKFQGDREVNEQILLNYSFGHPKSSLLLIPYTPFVSFVNNHVDKNKVNAKLQWSQSDFHKKSWEDNTVDEIVLKNNVGLMLDLVATRDIRENDEIFLDYGSDWDEAWEKHVKTWSPSTQDYMPSDMLNKEPVIRTLKEQENDPYGYNARTFCGLRTRKLVHDIMQTNGKVALNWADYEVTSDEKHSTRYSENIQMCRVEDRTVIAENKFEYNISVSGKRNGNGDDAVMKVFVNGVPREEIEFQSMSYTSDLHLETAFRHAIGIPDEIFPVKWMDLSMDG